MLTIHKGPPLLRRWRPDALAQAFASSCFLPTFPPLRLCPCCAVCPPGTPCPSRPPSVLFSAHRCWAYFPRPGLNTQPAWTPKVNEPYPLPCPRICKLGGERSMGSEVTQKESEFSPPPLRSWVTLGNLLNLSESLSSSLKYVIERRFSEKGKIMALIQV